MTAGRSRVAGQQAEPAVGPEPDVEEQDVDGRAVGQARGAGLVQRGRDPDDLDVGL